MCLSVNMDVHPAFEDYRRTMAFGRVASCDILVWKVLRSKSFFSWKWFSPFRDDHRWRFGVEERAELKDELRLINNYWPSIEEGLHAFFQEEGALHLVVVSKLDGLEAFPAIIPKGSVFWIGKYGEIVSNRLVVYRSLSKATVYRLTTSIRENNLTGGINLNSITSHPLVCDQDRKGNGVTKTEKSFDASAR